MTTDALKERLIKLLGLARRGVGGEKDNARTILNRLLTQHGLTLADLEGEHLAVSMHWFPYTDRFEERVLRQVAGKVLNTYKPVEYTQGKTRALGFELIPPQAIEMDLLWKAYRAAWKEAQERHLHAFVQANNIFPAQDDSSKDEAPLSAEDLAEIARTLALARGIEPVMVRALGRGQ